jgi:hypothetical protein
MLWRTTAPQIKSFAAFFHDGSGAKAEDGSMNVALMGSLAQSGPKSGSPDTAITLQALQVERRMARGHCMFVAHRWG